MKHYLKDLKGKLCIFLILAMLLVGLVPIIAATTADVTVTATFAFVGISANASSYNFGVVAASSTTNTPLTLVAITNSSTVATNITISVTASTWTGGVAWTHSDTATPGADTVGLKAGKTGGSVSDVIVKYASPNAIYSNCPASTNFTYGMQLLAPTSGSDGVQKSNTVRLTAAAA